MNSAERIVGVAPGQIYNRLDGGAQVALMHRVERGEVLQVVEIEIVVDQNGVVELDLVEVETFQSRKLRLEFGVVRLQSMEQRGSFSQDFACAVCRSNKAPAICFLRAPGNRRTSCRSGPPPEELAPEVAPVQSGPWPATDIRPKPGPAGYPARRLWAR